MIKIFFFIFIFYCGWFAGMFLSFNLFLPADARINSILLKTLVLQNTGRNVFLTYYEELTELSSFELIRKNENDNSLGKTSAEINDSVYKLNFYQKNITNKWSNLFNSSGHKKFFSIQVLSCRNFDSAMEVFSDCEDTSSLITLETVVTKKLDTFHRVKIHGFPDRQSAIQFMKLNGIKGIVVVDY